MKKFILFLSGTLLSSLVAFAQCPNSDFTHSGAACAGQPINFINNSSGAVSYNWDFCSGDFDSSATLSLVDTNITGLRFPTGVTAVVDGTSHYAFVCDYNGGNTSFVEIDYGNSFSNAPQQITNFGNPFHLLNGTWGIAFIKESGIWYALISNIDNDQVIKYDFGAGLNSAPTAGSVLVSTNLSNPRGLDIAVDSAGNIFGVVSNYSSSSLTVLSFGNSINNTVSVGSPISVSGGPVSVSLAHECGNWSAFILAYDRRIVKRVDFGNSLLNTPNNIASLTLPSIDYAGGISVVNENAKWVLCVSYSDGNSDGHLLKSIIGNSLTNNPPQVISNTPLLVPSTEGMHLIKENSNWFGFVVSNVNSFQKVLFGSACDVNTNISTTVSPSNIIYNTGGTYNIALEATDAYGNKSYSSQQVSVNPVPQAKLIIQNTCFGDSTSFSDSSAINAGSIVSRHWDFGDGGESTLQHVKHIYSASGSYTIVLSDTSDFGCASVKTQTVTIHPKPSANFSAPFPVCPHTNLQFTDLSTIPSDSIVQWQWNFGTGDSSTQQNPLYAYAAGGSYHAVLTVTSDSGCSASHATNISIYDAPHAGFVVSNTCLGGTAAFTDTSSINSGAITSWHWDFGDGNSDNSQNTTHPYIASIATYSVSLLVASNNACRDSVVLAVKINNTPITSFNYTPATVCEGNAVQFNDLSAVTGDTIYAWHWNFGDGDSSTTKNPIHAFAAAGSYSVVLTAYAQTSCGASSLHLINVVQSPVANFSFNTACLGDSMNFTDNSSPAFGTTLSHWHWDFGDGDTSNVVNPGHLFHVAGNHTVTLTVTDNIGCNNVLVSSVVIHKLPVTGFTTDVGCTSAPVNFLDGSTSTDGSISFRSWHFGDPATGSSDSSNDAQPSHFYHSAGAYDVSLFVTSVYGCSAEFDTTVDVLQASAANFQYLPTCEGHQMIFTNLDTIPSIDSTWTWSFGDGNAQSFIPSPSHFYLNPGTYNVTLSVISMGGCVSTITKPVEVSPTPIADFVQSPVCLNTAYSFSSSSHVSSGSITAWHWQFGNGDTADVSSPSVIYSDTGNYIVNLAISTARGCTASVTHTIQVFSLPSANFNYYPLFGSPPLLITFNDLSQHAAAYAWHFGDGDTSSRQSPSHTYLDTGKYTATQVVYSDKGCRDSLSKIIYIIQPKLDIAVTSISYHVQNNLFSISAQVANLGTRDISSYYMEAALQNGATIDEYVQTPLLSGAQGITTYTFTAAFQVSPEMNINYYCVRAVKPDGEADDVPSNDEKCATVSTGFSIAQPFPNPFSDQLQLQFILPYKGSVIAEIFNNMGAKISTVYNGDANAGGTIMDLNTSTFESGTYFCRFTFRDQTIVVPVVKLESKK